MQSQFGLQITNWTQKSTNCNLTFLPSKGSRSRQQPFRSGPNIWWQSNNHNTFTLDNFQIFTLQAQNQKFRQVRSCEILQKNKFQKNPFKLFKSHLYLIYPRAVHIKQSIIHRLSKHSSQNAITFWATNQKLNPKINQLQSYISSI